MSTTTPNTPNSSPLCYRPSTDPKEITHSPHYTSLAKRAYDLRKRDLSSLAEKWCRQNLRFLTLPAEYIPPEHHADHHFTAAKAKAFESHLMRIEACLDEAEKGLANGSIGAVEVQLRGAEVLVRAAEEYVRTMVETVTELIRQVRVMRNFQRMGGAEPDSSAQSDDAEKERVAEDFSEAIAVLKVKKFRPPACFPTIGAPMPVQMQSSTSQSPSRHESAATHEETFAHQFAEVQGASQAHAAQQMYFDPTMEDQLPLPAVPFGIQRLQYRPNASFQYNAYFNGLRVAYQQVAVLSDAYELLGDEYLNLPLSVRNTCYLPFYQRAFARDSFMIQPNGALPMPLMLLRMLDEALEAMADALETVGEGEDCGEQVHDKLRGVDVLLERMERCLNGIYPVMSVLKEVASSVEPEMLQEDEGLVEAREVTYNLWLSCFL
ncbi:hypothetical protein KC332_g10228 [Hortaea werneckii]|nr:hypothetical protein KC358_g10123 [Hortaea werneckii]KAI6822305.1 hypothetical protein KC350_g9400 [Hortaea werneckii]KAI6920991.1 hypothetical protein KC348_g10272 [Hortaea werneckii]KAI6930838.1 hypothetical protein KC341_g9969 [Hortaea werneckii]KAI6965389.1 hypothetical protein KC321_g10125 [Hortaea werneckii]